MTTTDEALRVAREEMARYLPILMRLEDSPLWSEFTAGLGIATINGYVRALRTIALAGESPPPVAPSDPDAWYCEEHPESFMGHDGCRGAGIQEGTRIHMLLNKLRLAEQETRETAMVRDDLAARLRRLLPAVQSVALTDPTEKLRRCPLRCLEYGQCKANMHGVPSECAASASGAVGETAGKAENVEQIMHCADIYGDARIMASRGRVDLSEVDEARDDLRALVSRILGLPGTSNGQENGNG